MGESGAPGRRESALERADRNFSDLLQELRVALPGVQVLFAFLLVVPFNQGFERVTDFQRDVYFGTLLCAATAAAFLIAPAVHHRLEFHKQDKEHIVKVSNRLAITGLTLLAFAMCGTILLITDVLFSAAMTAIVTALLALLFALLWYAIPLRRRAR